MQIHALALRVQLEVEARIVVQNRGSALLSHRHEVILLLALLFGVVCGVLLHIWSEFCMRRGRASSHLADLARLVEGREIRTAAIFHQFVAGTDRRCGHLGRMVGACRSC